MTASPRVLRALAVSALVAACVPASAIAAPPANVDLSTYTRVGRFDLPHPTRTTAPAGNVLGEEASGVTYDWDTNSLFVVGDGGTNVTQVTKTGQLVDTMTFAPGVFLDPEGIAYVGNGQFVITEERERRAVRFTYQAGGTLTRAAAQTVKLGTTIGNIGLEGLTWDPVTNGYIFVKESGPLGIFQTSIDFGAGTASNGSATTENSTNLFDPALAGLNDLSDVFALANVTGINTAQRNNLLLISQESAKVEQVTRAGAVLNSFNIVSDPGNPLTVQAQTHEGVTMDNDGVIYVVSEEGGGDATRPQLWAYAPAGSTPNAAPTAVTLTNQVFSIPSNTSTATRVKVANVAVTDDAAGTNVLGVTGADAASFEVDATGLYLKAGTVLNKASFSVAVTVDDTTVGATPDATSATQTITITPAPATPSLVVTEVTPWSSGNSPYSADWFEVSNTGTQPADVTGYRVDDSSNAFGSALLLNGVTTIAPGESVIFIEGNAATADAFKAFWFGGATPAGLQIGTYSGSGIGLSTDGDAVNLFTPGGARVSGVTFGASTNFFTFDNAAGATAVTQLSQAGVNGAFTIGGATGSPGRIANPTSSVTVPGTVTGQVPAQLALTLGAPAAFAPFTAGLTKDYFAETTATVTSTAGAAALTVVDPSTTAPGRLVNGGFALPQPLQVNAKGGAYAAVSGTPATLVNYTAPVGKDVVTVGLKQSIGENDGLRTGAYAKTLTFTLATTAP
jgi:uncharacterized protein YjiK